ncbi:MAG: hypoxanthine phosphoribosyltransferase [Candidatus Tokpelaia sp. JSC085]|nr:MAG: hypoxanthine phosphoribosyltransferase [Candidatus Tokpelaia sp. JSC085]
MPFHISFNKTWNQEANLKNQCNVMESMPFINGKTVEILFSEDEIARRNQAIAEAIAATRPERLLILPILKGSFVFAADLIRALYQAGVALAVEFVTVSSYGSGRTSGNILHLLHDIQSDISGHDVLLIDYVLDSGKTLKFVSDLVWEVLIPSLSLCFWKNPPCIDR